MGRLNLSLLLLLGTGHLVTDLAQGALPVINLFLAEALKLSYFQVGIISLSFTFSSAIIQPVFGFFSDRIKLVWLLPLGCFLSGLGLALTGAAPAYWLLLILVLVSGLGVAGYHPEGSKTAFLASGAENRFLSMSIFSVGGNVGIGLGPVIAYFLLGHFGLKGTVGLLAPGMAIAVIFLAVGQKINDLYRPVAGSLPERKIQPKSRVVSIPLVLIILYVTARSWIHAGLVTYYPFYCVNYLGMDKTYASTALTVFLMAGALGTFLGGPIADRWGDKAVLAGSMLFSALSISPFVLSKSAAAGLFFAALAGAVLIATFSTTVVYGQRLLPDHVGMASGLMLGFAIGMGSVGVSVLGYLADHLGLPAVMRIISLLPAAGLGLALLLPHPGGPAADQKGALKTTSG